MISTPITSCGGTSWKYHTPQYDGKPVVLPVSHLGWGGMKTSTSLKLIEQITKEKIGFENFWMDAGWYGRGPSGR